MAATLIIISSCYSLSGSSIDPTWTTIRIATFPNYAPLQNPNLSQEFTNALQDIFNNRTKLSLTNDENADLLIDGEITGYQVSSVAIQANEIAGKNRLTVTVRVRYQNNKNDIPLLFRKFCADFATKYRMPPIELTPEATQYIVNYPWPGNIRQLRNVAEEISVVEKDRLIGLEKIQTYLPYQNTMPALVNQEKSSSNADHLEREILFKFLLEMKQDLNDLRALTLDLIRNKDNISTSNLDALQRVIRENNNQMEEFAAMKIIPKEELQTSIVQKYDYDDPDYEEVKETDESLSLLEKEKELIKKALEKYKGKRRSAADELGISERTLYRKIKQFDLE